MYNHSGYDCNIYIKQAFMAKMMDFWNFWSKNKGGGCGKVLEEKLRTSSKDSILRPMLPFPDRLQGCWQTRFYSRSDQDLDF